MDIAASIPAALLGIFFGLHAVMILSRVPMQVKNAEDVRVPYERYRLVAIPEAAAAVGLLVGIAVKPLAAAAAVGLTLLMLGAVIMRLRAHNPPKAVVGDLVVALVCAATAALQILAM